MSKPEFCLVSHSKMGDLNFCLERLDIFSFFIIVMWITSPRVPETRPSEHTMVQGILLWKNMFGIKNFDHTCQEPCGPLMWKNHVSNFFFFVQMETDVGITVKSLSNHFNKAVWTITVIKVILYLKRSEWVVIKIVGGWANFFPVGDISYK